MLNSAGKKIYSGVYRVAIILLAVIVLGVFSPGDTFALTGDTDEFSNINVPKTVKKGDVFKSTFTSRSFAPGTVHLAISGLTKGDCTIGDIVQNSTTGVAPETHVEKILYKAELTRDENFNYTATLDTKDIPEGEYRFWSVFSCRVVSYVPTYQVLYYVRWYFYEYIEITSDSNGSPGGIDSIGGVSPPTEGIFTDNSGNKITVNVAGITDSVWTGEQVKPVPAVTASSKKLTKGTDYTISYGANKNIGKGTLTIKGAGKYKGSIAASFRIVPKAPTGVKLTAAAKALKVKWTTPTKFKNQQITGYEVQYRYQDGSKWTAWKTKSFKISYKATVKTVTQTLKNLKAKKNYQVQVSAYKKVSGVNYYSAWTKVKAKKTK